MGFSREFEAVLAAARQSDAVRDPEIAARLVDSWIGLQAMKATAIATLGRPDVPGIEANIAKLLWAPWHQQLGELAIDVLGPPGVLAGPAGKLTDVQRLFLFTRADTIYGGSNEIQRNVIAERLLGLPRGH
jgi:hypothetical protein